MSKPKITAPSRNPNFLAGRGCPLARDQRTAVAPKPLDSNDMHWGSRHALNFVGSHWNPSGSGILAPRHYGPPPHSRAEYQDAHDKNCLAILLRHRCITSFPRFQEKPIGNDYTRFRSPVTGTTRPTNTEPCSQEPKHGSAYRPTFHLTGWAVTGSQSLPHNMRDR